MGMKMDPPAAHDHVE